MTRLAQSKTPYMKYLFSRLFLFLGSTAGLYVFTMGVLLHIKLDHGPLLLYTSDYYLRPGGNTWYRFREFDRAKYYDAIVIGSSHANQGYAPQTFADKGYSAYLLGNGGQGPIDSYQVLNEYVTKENCGLVILDVYGRVFAKDGFESAADFITNLPDPAPAWKMAATMGDLRIWNILAARCLWPSTNPERPSEYIALGYSSKPDSIKKPSGPPIDHRVAIPEYQINYLRKCIELCQRRAIPLVLSNHFLRKEDMGNVAQEVNGVINEFSRKYGVPYLNFSNAPGINDEDWFSDHVHLNWTGSRIFTDRLVDTLETLGYLGKQPMERISKRADAFLNGVPSGNGLTQMAQPVYPVCQ